MYAKILKIFHLVVLYLFILSGLTSPYTCSFMIMNVSKAN
ncbi:hypothetical protein SAMN04488541_1003164 [Thermoflexibacter ruber]|uniref:Uncharacterized protein n=1 Tax=Thermoflexibacter ruber TaxID=1003 RepID=A0A1I2BX08_9BACT|nr:hypothetical protein SAMN04488541_1003164 [Thermoflexibacter ruber]